MFTAAEIEWLKAFLQTNILNGDYKYYVAYTIDNTNNNYQSDTYDFIVVLSTDVIEQNNYVFNTNGNYKVVKVDSSGASYSNVNNRYVVDEGKGYTFIIDEYNHYYTNVKGNVNIDLLYQDILNIKYQQTDYIMNICLIVVLCISLLHKTLTSAFPFRLGD